MTVKLGRPLVEGSRRASRLQVRLTVRELGHVQRIAKRYKVTPSAWMRHLLRKEILRETIEREARSGNQAG